MSARCSFYRKVERECGEPRESSTFIQLVQCTSDVSSHLLNCHSSHKKISGYGLILARAGLFNLPDDVAELVVCAVHRHSLGKYWKPFGTCQYPSHNGKDNTPPQEPSKLRNCQRHTENVWKNIGRNSKFELSFLHPKQSVTKCLN